MRIQSDTQQLTSLIENAEDIVIFVGPFANADASVSALALRAVFEPLKKRVQIYYLGNLSEELLSLPGGNEIKNSLPPTELVISFDISEKSIDRVRYFVEDALFKLVIRPVEGSLDPGAIKYSKKSFN